MSEAFALPAVGFVVGFVSTLTGLGAGLSLPLLAWAGVPVPAALLAIKLPVAASDLAAALVGATWRPAGIEPDPKRAARRFLSALVLVAAGAVGAAWVSHVPAGVAAAAVAAVLVLALGLRRAGSGSTRALAWSVYLGACGACAGVLMAWQARREGRGFRDANVSARRLGAAANSGAVLMLFALGRSAGETVLTLALAQALGSALAAAARHRRGNDNRGSANRFRRARSPIAPFTRRP